MGFIGLPDAGRLRRKMEPIHISDDIHRIAIIKSFQKMYGFGGLGQVEVGMSPWQDKQTTEGKIGLLSQWTIDG